MAETPACATFDPPTPEHGGEAGGLGWWRWWSAGWGFFWGGVKPLRGGVEVPLGRARFSADGGS